MDAAYRSTAADLPTNAAVHVDGAKLVSSPLDKLEKPPTLVAAQSRIPLARAWGGGDVASADGLRFVVPIRTIHSEPNPRYYGQERGVIFYNLVSDQFTGLNDIAMPGTLRDSLTLLSVVLEQQTELQPTEIMSDTRSHTGTIFGIFHMLSP